MSASLVGSEMCIRDRRRALLSRTSPPAVVQCRIRGRAARAVASQASCRLRTRPWPRRWRALG
eukprot:4524640-Alexandrium_andersonii.AAC.1